MSQSRQADPFYPEPQLLAERTRYAGRERTCCLCPHPVARGERIADVAGGRGPAHLGCRRRGCARLRPGL
jgi:hypothetical protein